MDAKDVQALFPDYKSPWHLYSSVYKWTPCGPTIAMIINGEWYVNDELPTEWLGDISKIFVSSIVEGIEAEVAPIEVDLDKSLEPYDDFWSTVEVVNNQAGELWDNSHGCDECARRQGIDIEYEYAPIDPECPECHGEGIIL